MSWQLLRVARPCCPLAPGELELAQPCTAGRERDMAATDNRVSTS